MRLLTVLVVACVLAFSHLAAKAYEAVPPQMQNALKSHEKYQISANFLTGRKTESFSSNANGKEVTKTAHSRFRLAPVLLQDLDMSLGLEPAMARSIDLHR